MNPQATGARSLLMMPPQQWGASGDEATALLSDQGLEVGTVDEVDDPETEKGKIIASNPGPNTSVATQATKAESAPPENATTTDRWRPNQVRRKTSASVPSTSAVPRVPKSRNAAFMAVPGPAPISSA